MKTPKGKLFSVKSQPFGISTLHFIAIIALTDVVSRICTLLKKTKMEVMISQADAEI